MKIRHIKINNFRGIRALNWMPSEGITCLIGSSDSCKSTILDAIDYTLGARKQAECRDLVTEMDHLDGAANVAEDISVDIQDDIKVELKVDPMLLLEAHDCPPVDKDEVYKEIFAQAENFKKHKNNYA